MMLRTSVQNTILVDSSLIVSVMYVEFQSLKKF